MLVGILSIVAAAGVSLIDQLIKIWATAELLPAGSRPLIPHVVELHYLLNDGMSFSMLSGKRELLITVTGVMLAVMAVMLVVGKMSFLERFAWILVLGGGLGNLVDRIRTGVVVDYINLLFIQFPVFNFADICICVGVGMLILCILLDMRREKNAAKQELADDEEHGAS
ncbi:MAG: signal peptidase II [Gemmiger sp.]